MPRGKRSVSTLADQYFDISWWKGLTFFSWGANRLFESYSETISNDGSVITNDALTVLIFWSLEGLKFSNIFNFREFYKQPSASSYRSFNFKIRYFKWKIERRKKSKIVKLE